MGTGGGESLARIIAGLSPATRVVATEEWVVNAPVAHRRLAPLGVAIVRCHSRQLPFGAATFDLVLNRHEELDPAEVARVLQPGGRLVTQQVGSDNWPELRRFFPHMADFGDHYHAYAASFRRAGLAVDRAIHAQKVAYASVGDVVFMLLVAPWEIPDFDPERELEALLALEEECGTEAGIVLTETRYLLTARKPD
jgi:SAM-dependent methyltransferase